MYIYIYIYFRLRVRRRSFGGAVNLSMTWIVRICCRTRVLQVLQDSIMGDAMHSSATARIHVRRDTFLCDATHSYMGLCTHCSTLQHIAARYSTLQHAAALCNILQHTARQHTLCAHSNTHKSCARVCSLAEDLFYKRAVQKLGSAQLQQTANEHTCVLAHFQLICNKLHMSTQQQRSVQMCSFLQVSVFAHFHLQQTLLQMRTHAHEVCV